ncbi:hypothetical protein TVAG_302600 [Trichomonas vaginalis G3]|uniref:Uncharacterized protein n=1 Tax=Trichomonas vaginalis (strain ATCC PRA-98 / G3) TaxID=412133 RepID=A2EGT5_TRIV3|nr:hypothetical protein TVAGG3_0172660 [Trichomonas vaginalis G3]EAY08173.1 hypothetical protein TVAG_302600 [Trichomonas vaginalis G3]KAI5548695.1 hypothetical protein TVAGG3_0172660 [Trichomonas vaginalis G3]|eukprot:XP_001320396.1 hypothetical protein [Trichomonas vaginalis G3]
MSKHNNYTSTRSKRQDGEEYSDGNPNDQWTPDDPDSKEDYVRDYSSDADEMKYKKKRIRKKGRKAKFLAEQLMYDQQMMANQQTMMQFQPQQTYHPPPPQLQPQPIITFQQPSYTNKQLHSIPELESVGPNHIPGIIDVVPRGQH